MMKTCRTFVAATTLAALLAFTGGTAHAQDCQPGIGPAFQANAPNYALLFNALAPTVGILQIRLSQLTDQATYASLLTDARTVAASLPNGRLLITLPDGSVVLDTARQDDPTNVMAVGNSYQHYIAKTVNENHNSRVAILAAQQYPCGLGLERKPSTTTGQTESYVAVRLGNHLDNLGTARISITQ